MSEFTERERERQRQTETDRDTDRETDRETETETGREHDHHLDTKQSASLQPFLPSVQMYNIFKTVTTTVQ